MASIGVDETAPSANGIPGNVITGGGISLPLDYSNYETEFYILAEIPADISDTMTPTTNAFPILSESSGGTVGIAYPKLGLDRTGRVVFLSFPLDAVSATVAAPNNRATLMQRILNFLAPGQEGIGSITLDNSEFTLPSLATIEVGDSDLAGAGQVSVTVSSTTEPTPRTLVLPEFGRFGIFRGTLPIVSSHGDDPAHELVAAHGDTILASYFDASRNASVTFTARVETIPPIISSHFVEPDFVERHHVSGKRANIVMRWCNSANHRFSAAPPIVPTLETSSRTGFGRAAAGAPLLLSNRQPRQRRQRRRR